MSLAYFELMAVPREMKRVYEGAVSSLGQGAKAGADITCQWLSHQLPLPLRADRGMWGMYCS